MSLPEFMSSFGTEEQCAEAVRHARWPQGFECPRCGTAAHYVVGLCRVVVPRRGFTLPKGRGTTKSGLPLRSSGHYQRARKLFQRNGCRHQTSLTAGSLFASTKLPLRTWFLAIYLISQTCSPQGQELKKTGLSALPRRRSAT